MRAPYIGSSSNQRVQRLRDLHSAAGRREHGAFLVEGTRLVSEAVAARWDLPFAVFDRARAEEDLELSNLVELIPTALPASAIAVKHAADTVSPQGIVAAAVLPSGRASIDPAEPLVLIMDGVSDPGNAGSLLRSALGAGVRTVLALRGTVDLFSPKVVRAGMGAHFRLNLMADLAWPEAEESLGRQRRIVLADATGELPYHGLDWLEPAALVVGSEAHGPSAEARKRASVVVSIPLEGSLESLNAAIAGSIVMFEAKRQRDMSGLGGERAG